MESITPILVTTILTPIAATIVGLFAARFDVTAHLKKTEYRLKRLELIEKLLSIKPKLENNIEKLPDWSFIGNELLEIADFVVLTKTKKNHLEYKFETRPFLIRAITLPKPRTLVGGLVP